MNYCLYSCTIFLTNSILAYTYDEILYSILFFVLVLTSIFLHSSRTWVANILDKIAILGVTFYGGHLFFTYPPKHIIISTFIYFTFFFTIYLYYIGYLTHQYCFHDDSDLANQYHSLLHMVASIGHHAILFSIFGNAENLFLL
jgi:hypothetical protein